MAPPVLLPWLNRLEASPVGTRLAGGMLWSGVGAVASRGLALIASIVIARLIGREAFGALGVTVSTLSMFSTFAVFGLNLTATKHIAEYRKTDPARAGRVMALSRVTAWGSGIAAALVMAAAAPALARTLAAPELGGLLALAAVALLFTVVNQVQMGALSGFEAFRRNSMIQTVAGLVSFPLTVIAVWLWALPGAVLGLVVSALLLVMLGHRGVRKEAALAGVPVSWKGWSQEKGILWHFSMPTVLAGAVYVPVMWLANVIIVNTPQGYAAMGLFSAADRWRTAITFVPILMGGVTLPLLSSLLGERDFRKYRKVLWTSVALSGLAAAALAVPIAAVSPWIMAGYGPAFAQGKWALITLCASAVASSAYWIISQSLISRARVWSMFWLNVEWSVLFMAAVWMLRHLGATGLAAAYLIADSLRLGTALLFVGGYRPGAGPAAPVAEGSLADLEL